MSGGAGRPRYEPYALPNRDGHGVWDNLLGKRVEQPGLTDSHWFPRSALARAWADRENAAYTAGLSGSRRPPRPVPPGTRPPCTPGAP